MVFLDGIKFGVDLVIIHVGLAQFHQKCLSTGVSMTCCDHILKNIYVYVTIHIITTFASWVIKTIISSRHMPTNDA